jgi:lipopolysaccharide/colanic/teichoic acid biosynthesis glycosyltransferase
MLSKIWNAKQVRALHSAREFASILNRERDRSDRTGQEFSLVVFEGNGNTGKYSTARRLVPILARRVRSTDDIGWLKDGRIGVALPHTASDGAWKFVDTVRQANNGKGPLPDCTVFSYPSWWISVTGEKPPLTPRAHKPTPPRPENASSEMRSSNVKTADRVEPIEKLESQLPFRIPAWKRAIDVLGSIIALILLSPLLLLVALLIRIVSPGPILFQQIRVGYLGRTFTIWKFRTMHANADTAVHLQHMQEAIRKEKELTKLDNAKDNRIIPFGNLLRVTGIDELPQLLNVLRGDMSLIGPRPCLPYEVREYQDWQKRRFDAVPGLTGLWQVSGKNRTTFKEMMRLDIAYAKQRAFLLDVKIYLKTLPAIIGQVLDRPSFANARSKAISLVLRVGAIIIAGLTLNAHRK